MKHKFFKQYEQNDNNDINVISIIFTHENNDNIYGIYYNDADGFRKKSYSREMLLKYKMIFLQEKEFSSGVKKEFIKYILDKYK